MTAYAWPWPWATDGFDMRVQPNERVFASAFNPASAQVVGLGGDYWVATVRVPSNDRVHGAEIEAFLNRLRGSQNSLSLYHLKRQVPRGTMRGAESVSVVNGSLAPVSVVNGSLAAVSVVGGTPILLGDVAQFDTVGTIVCRPGKTLLAGDIVVVNGQVVMQLVDTIADSSGQMPIEFAPSARSVFSSMSVLGWDKPTVSFRLKDGVAPPVSWRPGMYEAITLDLIEAI